VLLALGPTRQSATPTPIIPHMAQASPWIAIVDDDPSVLKALARLLSAHGIEVRTYMSARDFLASLADAQPECLVVDLQMPEMTGLELQRHLIRAGIRIPTIVITAHDEPEMRELCKSMGASDFLSKPLQDTSLLAAIGKAGGRDAGDHEGAEGDDP
jgi:FixJ family two-component response regulator